MIWKLNVIIQPLITSKRYTNIDMGYIAILYRISDMTICSVYIVPLTVAVSIGLLESEPLYTRTLANN